MLSIVVVTTSHSFEVLSNIVDNCLVILFTLSLAKTSKWGNSCVSASSTIKYKLPPVQLKQVNGATHCLR